MGVEKNWSIIIFFKNVSIFQNVFDIDPNSGEYYQMKRKENEEKNELVHKSSKKAKINEEDGAINREEDSYFWLIRYGLIGWQHGHLFSFKNLKIDIYFYYFFMIMMVMYS